MKADPMSLGNLLGALELELERQDRIHGPLPGGTNRGRRLMLALLQDELDEALEAWREERNRLLTPGMDTEILQVAALAIRAIRDNNER